MKKVLLLILCFLMIGCQQTIEGHWVSPGGSTEITFADDQVIFFGVKGTYAVIDQSIVLYLGSSTLTYGFEVNKNEMTLYLEGGTLILERE